MNLDETARLAGGYRWAESRLFEVLGGWVQSTADGEAKLVLDRHSQHHAWRAGQWWDRLPVLAGVDREQLVVPLHAGARAAFAAIAGLQEPLVRLAGTYRFAYPRLLAAYEGHRSRANPVSEDSVIRTLNIVSTDLVRDWCEGELILQRLLDDDGKDGFDDAGRTVARLEQLWVTPGL